MQIVEAYRTLGSGHAVAKELGLSSPTVYSALKANGVPLVWRGGILRVPAEAIVKAYRKLGSGLRVAAKLNISDRTVYEVLGKHGVETGTYWKTLRHIDGKDAKKAVAMYRAGRSVPAIAAKFNVSAAAIRGALEREQVYKTRPKWSQEEKHRAVALYVSGLTLKQVAVELSRSQRQLSVLFHREHPDILRPNHGFGPESKTWKGGRMLHHGYMYVLVPPTDPLAEMRSRAGYVVEHRLVLARTLGRPLRPDETVHHIDGNKTNNDPTNLQLRHGKHGKGAPLCCADCGSRNIIPVPLSESRDS